MSFGTLVVKQDRLFSNKAKNVSFAWNETCLTF
jgi:hypothetical protein